MPPQVMEAVPNFSEGRDRRVIEAIVAAVTAAGAEVWDWSMDADHHRSVVTFAGTSAQVERAVLAAAVVACERIDLRRHRGLHPRIGALDVVPIVPLAGADMADARVLARRIGHSLASELGVPVYFYGEASEPPGRELAELRRGGFETLAAGWPIQRTPDIIPADWLHPGAHPSAGATCVGARPVLLAWNVWLDGVAAADAATIAQELRERGGGFRGLRALALTLPERGSVQLSMNLEDLEAVSPLEVFTHIEARVQALGGRLTQTEVIGMIPDQLALAAAADRFKLTDATRARLLTARLAEHVLGRTTATSADQG
ncbi:MAG: glutamate formimidoyltransferase [Longimicrobiales bacterium]